MRDHDTGRRRVRLTLQYIGAAYSGWQLQKNADTVQARVEAAFGAVCGKPVRVHGAGRTDAGVHAWGQVAHASPPGRVAGVELARALNANLPADIRVVTAEDVPPDFHARYDAVGKTYVYAIRHHGFPSVRDMGFRWRLRRPLDVAAMRKAAALFPGKRDFRAFASVPPEKDAVRHLRRLDLFEAGPDVYVVVEADGFLWKMVRGIVGTLVEVGRGRMTPAQLPGVVESGERERAGPSAPGEGLTLLWVDYGEGKPAWREWLPPPWPTFF